MKTYVITVAKNFLSTHPKKGTPTNFREQILDGRKLHTIRGNYEYWKNIVDKVNSGEAILSVRQWSGKPYNSKQEEVTQFTKLGIQGAYFNKTKVPFMRIDGKPMRGLNFDIIAKNDGFAKVDDFVDWFPKIFNGCIIQFTEHKY